MAQDVDKPDQLQLIGARVRATREALGLTQIELADILQVGRTALAQWERGANLPNPLAMSRMADRFGVTLDWIYRGNMAGLQHSLATKIDPLMSRSSRTGG